MARLHFSNIDFYESAELLGLGLVDFDKTYPHITKQIEAWAEKWKPSIYRERVKAVGEVLQITTLAGNFNYIVHFEHDRLDLLPYIETLINLKTPGTLEEIINILENLMPPHKYFLSQVPKEHACLPQ